MLLADAGYYSDDNITDANDDDPELLIATLASSRVAAGKIDPGQVRHRSKVARQMTERLTSHLRRMPRTLRAAGLHDRAPVR